MFSPVIRPVESIDPVVILWVSQIYILHFDSVFTYYLLFYFFRILSNAPKCSLQDRINKKKRYSDLLFRMFGTVTILKKYKKFFLWKHINLCFVYQNEYNFKLLMRKNWRRFHRVGNSLFRSFALGTFALSSLFK